MSHLVGIFCFKSTRLCMDALSKRLATSHARRDHQWVNLQSHFKAQRSSLSNRSSIFSMASSQIKILLLLWSTEGHETGGSNPCSTRNVIGKSDNHILLFWRQIFCSLHSDLFQIWGNRSSSVGWQANYILTRLRRGLSCHSWGGGSLAR